MGVAVLYQCTIGFRCFKYFGTILVLHDKGVDTYNKGKVEEYTWDNLEVKKYAFATTTQIKCKNGQTGAYFSDGLANLNLLVETIKNGIT
ncbi:MAG: hypothetical protein ACI9C4_001523 [Paraglaciecola sp.]|jgi:hypothetical protein